MATKLPSSSSKVYSLFKTSLKIGIAGGAIYSTTYLGVWGRDTSKTEMAFKDAATTVDGYLGGDYLTNVRFPSSHSYIDKWNSGVTTAFNSIDNLPNNVSDKATTTKKFINSKMS